MLCAQRVASIVTEGDVQSSPFLAEAHVIVGSAPFLARQGSAPITLYLSHLRAKAAPMILAAVFCQNSESCIFRTEISKCTQ